MKLLITILQAAHCRSTHQFFALDSLPLVQSPSGKQLARLLLHHHDAYLTGSKDPDKVFRDFQNHVLHVSDNCWGGAARTAEKWLQKTIGRLNAQEWEEAAYSAGVLSHYFTDPIMPLHTAQSERESIYHRAMEWSVNQSYAKIRRQFQNQYSSTRIQLSSDDNWLSQLIKECAQVSHESYEWLLDRYDLETGSKKPKQGFDGESIDRFAQLFSLAIKGWAQVLQRISCETRIDIPPFRNGAKTIGAALEMPAAWVVRRIESDQEREAVQAIFDEYQRTGTVNELLPDEVKVVRQNRELDREPDSETSGANDSVTMEALGPNSNKVDEESEVGDLSVQQIRRRNAAEDRIAAARARSNASRAKGEVVGPEIRTLRRRGIAQPTVPRTARHASQSNSSSSDTPAQGSNRSRLSRTHELVDAPSIGPKTAARFARIGIHTVGQFLDGDSQQMAESLATRWIKEELIVDWQHQAKLVCEVPSLCGYKAQLLVGVGCRTTAQLAIEETNGLHAKISSFAKTSEGQRVLRSSKTPEPTEVAKWINDASAAGNSRSAA